jgi:hypothetical protein
MARNLDSGLGPFRRDEPPLDYLWVCSTDPAIGDLDFDLAGTGLKLGNVLYFEVIWAFKDSGFHSVLPPQPSSAAIISSPRISQKMSTRLRFI